MQCARCGTAFDGRFCPQCGAPAVPPEATSMPWGGTPAGSWPCPRCGTLYFGNFCPRCGLPTASWAYRPSPPSGGRAVLTILWTLAIVAFLVLAATDFAGLAISPTQVVPGIEGIRSGQTANAALEVDARNWSANSWGTGSALSYQSGGGHPDGYLKMTLFSSGSRGYWIQAFPVTGRAPFSASVRLDVEIGSGLSSGWLFVSVDSSPSDPDPRTAIAAVPFNGALSWTGQGPFRNDTQILDTGVYYLKVGFVANVTSGPVDVGLDNVRLSWTTDAGLVFYVPVPYPGPRVVSQDKALFLTYYGFIASAIFLFAAYYAVRERKEIWIAIRAPVHAIGTRLRSRSAWIALAQVWMAVSFFQVAVIALFPLFGVKTTTPIPRIDARNAWVYLFELANAGVYEEFAFRLLLIGAPMALGSIGFRIYEVTHGPEGRLPGSTGRYVVGGWRYLFGGVLRRDSSKEAHVAAWAFVFASAAFFGLAHVPGWGWWKAAPTFVAGLGFGYLFLRHGIGASILAHFVNDYILALNYEGIGGFGLELFISLLFLGLAIAGAGFLVWYAIEALRHLRALIAQFRPPRPTPPAATPTPSPGAPSPVAYGFPAPPSSPPPNPYPGGRFGGWSPVPTTERLGTAFRDPTRVPRDYVPSYVPPPYGYPPVRFQCPSCGWVEARYEGGRFTCTRCGRTA